MKSQLIIRGSKYTALLLPVEITQTCSIIQYLLSFEISVYKVNLCAYMYYFHLL